MKNSLFGLITGCAIGYGGLKMY